MNKQRLCILLTLVLTLAMALPALAGGANTLTLTATSGADYISLSWTPASNANGLTGYYVYRSTQSGVTPQNPVNDFPSTVTTLTDRNIEKGITYYYTVRPFYGSALGSPSNEVSARAGSTGATIIMHIGSPDMMVNGVVKPIDPSSSSVWPELKNNRTFVPIRAIVEALGGTTAYDSSTRMVTITLGNKTLNLWIDSKNIKVNGVESTMDVAPYINSSRTYLPLRFVLENLNCTTQWEGQTGKITINQGILPGGSTSQVTGSASAPGNVTPGTSTPTVNNDGTGTTTPSGNTTTPPVISKPEVNGPGVFGTIEAPASLLTWTGTWDTSYGVLTLTQNGNQVTGTYPDGTLTGTVSANKLTGTFSEINSYNGTFVFTMSSNGQSFTGTWHYNGDSENSEWNGTREN